MQRARGQIAGFQQNLRVAEANRIMQQAHAKAPQKVAALKNISHIAKHERIIGRNGGNAGQCLGTNKFHPDRRQSAVVATGAELQVNRNVIDALHFATFERAKCEFAFAGVRPLDHDFVVGDREMRMQERDAKTVIGAFGDQQFANFVKARQIALIVGVHHRRINIGQGCIV